MGHTHRVKCPHVQVRGCCPRVSTTTRERDQPSGEGTLHVCGGLSELDARLVRLGVFALEILPCDTDARSLVRRCRLARPYMSHDVARLRLEAWLTKYVA
jgi:hypothetical protein